MLLRQEIICRISVSRLRLSRKSLNCVFPQMTLFPQMKDLQWIIFVLVIHTSRWTHTSKITRVMKFDVIIAKAKEGILIRPFLELPIKFLRNNLPHCQLKKKKIFLFVSIIRQATPSVEFIPVWTSLRSTAIQ